MDFFNVLSVKEVNLIIEKLTQAYKIETETVSLMEALHRVVSTDYLSPVNMPEFNRSTVDGYAVISQDIMGASESMPSFLTCNHEVRMGEWTDLKVEKGQAIYVPTGGMVPEGADGVVMIEYVEKLDHETLLIHRPIAPGENMTYIGDDLAKDEIVIKKGKKISPYDMGLLAGIGISQVQVYKLPTFSIISTGDEIIDLDEPQSRGQIRDINGYALAGLIQQIGGKVMLKTLVKDDFSLLKKAVEQAVEVSDIVLLSGGSSVGTRDYTKDVIESFEGGKVMVHGISIKPGKPTIIGSIQDKIVFGLPGHPASALIIFNLFVRRYTDLLFNKDQNEFHIFAVLESNVHSSPGKETFQMVQLEQKDKEWRATPLYGKSGMMTLLAKASGYIRISENEEGLLKGQRVEVGLFQEVNI